MDEFIEKISARKQESISQEEGIQMMDDIMANTSDLPEDFEPFRQQLSEVEPLDADRIYQQSARQDQTTTSQPTNEETEGPATLNDRFSTQQKESLAEVLQKRKIENIKSHISINQRFMFINELFNGDADIYNDALEKVDNCQSMNEALDYLQKNFVQQYQWDMESEEVAEFMDVLSKKYA